MVRLSPKAKEMHTRLSLQSLDLWELDPVREACWRSRKMSSRHLQVTESVLQSDKLQPVSLMLKSQQKSGVHVNLQTFKPKTEGVKNSLR